MRKNRRDRVKDSAVKSLKGVVCYAKHALSDGRIVSPHYSARVATESMNCIKISTRCTQRTEPLAHTHPAFLRGALGTNMSPSESMYGVMFSKASPNSSFGYIR